jgi:uncharacterized protein
MTELERLLAVQEIDAAIVQAGHRRERLPERAALAAAVSAVGAAEAARSDALRRGHEAAARIEDLERSGAARQTKRARLEAQLKTVIAPREAEALMHEIATLDAERDVADDEELALLDASETADADGARAAADLDVLVPGAEAAREALAAAEAQLLAEVAALTEQRAAAAGHIDAGLLARYESRRASLGGIGIARVAGGRCSACHLDLSRTLLDEIKRAALDTLTECEQCGRWLLA